VKGLSGLEYDLVMLFAKQMKVKVEFIIPDTFDDLLKQISEGKADIAAAGLTITEQRKLNMRFSPSYQSITEQIVYRAGQKKPKNISALSHGIIEIIKGTSHIDTLTQLQSSHPHLSWNVNSKLNTDGLMYLINSGLIDYTIADSHQISIIKRFYPKLNVAFDITSPRQLAWAFPLSDDNSFYDKVSVFFKHIKQNKTLEHLLEKHYGNSGKLNYVGNCIFRRHIKSRLPLYEHLFKAEAIKYDIDWRLLAAIGYQESHWRSEAVSPTGVKGLMMLTKKTAKQLGIKDRTDPAQSIAGGALYFKQRLKKIASHIQEPDRTWFALASYNVGFGHLKDAQKLTKNNQGNPDKWMDVRKTLPLLSQKKWYKQTRYGYARGKEPVRYVENIRSYYDLLIWLTEENQIEKSVMSLKPEEPEQTVNKVFNFEPFSL
jgi:membrane-bound lytic murein transglycosylase F